VSKEVYSLIAREKFTCLGSECSRDCCHGWDFVEVDDKTISKWTALSEQGDTSLLADFIELQADETPIMRMSDEKACLALDSDKLCSIQRRFGHEFISDTCRNFPRLDYNNKFRNYSTASLSCPDIVEQALFSNDDIMFMLNDNGSDEEVFGNNDDVLFALDTLLSDILDLTDYSLGQSLFFVSDLFSDIIKNMSFDGVTENDIRGVRVHVADYLSDIKKAVKQGKIKTNPVTSGSYWKTVFGYCQTRGVKAKFLENRGSPLRHAVEHCDDSFPGFGKVYAVIKRYKKKANKQIKHQYNDLLRKYVRLVFINKGFPLAPKSQLSFVLVECMVNISVLQLLMWIEVNKNDQLSDDFLKECIVEVDRKFVQSNVLVKTLEQDGHMQQVDKYCNAFLDIF